MLLDLISAKKVLGLQNNGIRIFNFVVGDMLNDYSYLGKFDGCAVIAGLVHHF